MGPQHQIEYSIVGRGIENTLGAQDTIYQRDADKAAIGVHCGQLLDGGAAGILPEEYLGEKNGDRIGDERAQNGPHKTAQKRRVEVNLVGFKDEKRRNEHQQQIRHSGDRGGIDEVKLKNSEAAEENDEHLKNFAEDNGGHGISFPDQVVNGCKLVIMMTACLVHRFLNN